MPPLQIRVPRTQTPKYCHRADGHGPGETSCKPYPARRRAEQGTRHTNRKRAAAALYHTANLIFLCGQGPHATTIFHFSFLMFFGFAQVGGGQAFLAQQGGRGPGRGRWRGPACQRWPRLPNAPPQNRVAAPSGPMLMVISGVLGRALAASAVACSSSAASARVLGMTARLGDVRPGVRHGAQGVFHGVQRRRGVKVMLADDGLYARRARAAAQRPHGAGAAAPLNIQRVAGVLLHQRQQRGGVGGVAQVGQAAPRARCAA